MGQLGVSVGIAKMEVAVKTQDQKKVRTGIQFPRYFTTRLEAGKTPYDEIVWETRTASLGNDKGAVIFEQRDIDVASVAAIQAIESLTGREAPKGRRD